VAFEVAVCDLKEASSSVASWNMKSSGKRSRLRGPVRWSADPGVGQRPPSWQLPLSDREPRALRTWTAGLALAAPRVVISDALRALAASVDGREA